MIAYTLADFGRLVNLHDSFGPGLCNLQQAPGLSKLIPATISSDRTGGGFRKRRVRHKLLPRILSDAVSTCYGEAPGFLAIASSLAWRLPLSEAEKHRRVTGEDTVWLIGFTKEKSRRAPVTQDFNTGNWIIFQVASASGQLLFQGERVVQQLRWVDWVQFPLRRVDQGDPRGFFLDRMHGVQAIACTRHLEGSDSGGQFRLRISDFGLKSLPRRFSVPNPQSEIRNPQSMHPSHRHKNT